MNITFAGDKMDLLGSQVKVGDKAPDFKAIKRDLSEYNLKDDEGKILIISVVPSIDTGVCSIQTKFFNEQAAKLSNDIKILTISLDLPFAQERFCAAEGIDKADIVSDYRFKDFGNKYGFLIEQLQLLSRGVVIVDRGGKIAYVEYVDEVTNEVNFKKALNEVKKLA